MAVATVVAAALGMPTIHEDQVSIIHNDDYKIKKLITPKAMRRTAQDLSRLAGVNDLVTRAVSGHSDIAMQELYSTVRGEEMRKSLAAVVQLVGL